MVVGSGALTLVVVVESGSGSVLVSSPEQATATIASETARGQPFDPKTLGFAVKTFWHHCALLSARLLAERFAQGCR